ncbi:MAG: hypothetical protein JWP74_4192 [Marmoricola sp.]|nr:hypothetical protein [Marmoricola sp.]
MQVAAALVLPVVAAFAVLWIGVGLGLGDRNGLRRYKR